MGRPSDQKQTSHPFDNETEAERFRQDLTRYGHNIDQLMSETQKRQGSGFTVQAVVIEHLAQLDGIEETPYAKINP